MNKIPISERLPDLGQLVLVYGLCKYTIDNDDKEKSLGLVYFDKVDYSSVKDWDYYGVWYTDIEYWYDLSGAYNSMLNK